MSTNLDDAVMAATNRKPVFYGRVDYQVRLVSLTKGQGKVAFTDGMPIADRRTEIKFSLNPIDESGQTRMVERTLISESREFNKIVWASLKGLGLNHISELHNRYCKIELVPTGRVYTGKSGGEMEETTVKFLALYNSEDECVFAYRSDGAAEAQPEAKEQEDAGGNNAERATAAQFLPHIVKNANGNLQLLADTLKSMSPLNKYFDINSPEVQKLLQEHK